MIRMRQRNKQCYQNNRDQKLGKDLRESRLMPGSVLDPHTLAEAITLSAHRPGKGVHSLTAADTPHWFSLTWQA
jgi:hypothetical protein